MERPEGEPARLLSATSSEPAKKISSNLAESFRRAGEYIRGSEHRSQFEDCTRENAAIFATIVQSSCAAAIAYRLSTVALDVAPAESTQVEYMQSMRPRGGMADASVLGAGVRKDVGVRISPRPIFTGRFAGHEIERLAGSAGRSLSKPGPRVSSCPS